MKARKGDWVEIENLILQPEERSTNLPEDTRKVPLNMWVRGFLQTDEAEVGEEVEIITLTERKISGKLVEMAPRHNYDYGDTIIELIQIGEELKRELAKALERGVK
ncbi:MAG: 2-amino-4-oxopentanoate thiolase subunit OrtA [Maledivibacter sp.]|jgi:hypothetical protein|nr:2-amino-4-oxopentanoate thiolase subunit OrtA [Maledivibacter sp.]